MLACTPGSKPQTSTPHSRITWISFYTWNLEHGNGATGHVVGLNGFAGLTTAQFAVLNGFIAPSASKRSIGSKKMSSRSSGIHHSEKRSTCTASYPVDCSGDYCCPSGTTCAGDNTCVYPETCPASYPVNCDNGYCCPENTYCEGTGSCSYTAPVTSPTTTSANSATTTTTGLKTTTTTTAAYSTTTSGETCPTGYSVECGNGYCCKAGQTCYGTDECVNGALCPSTYPVNCDDEYCCPESTYCAGNNECSETPVSTSSSSTTASAIASTSTTAAATTTTTTTTGSSSVVTSWDWRDYGVVEAIKNQGSCGSCWAFSAAGAIESAYAIYTGSLTGLSEENLVDCSSSYGNDACDGGSMNAAFEYVIDNGGIDTEAGYPYTASSNDEAGTCEYSTSDKGAYISGYQSVSTEEALQTTVQTVGPVSVAIDASQQSFQLYESGVYDDPGCTTSVDHGVLAIGFNTENSTNEYWIIRNSWGTGWGIEGYFWIKKGNNTCGVAEWMVYPTVTSTSAGTDESNGVSAGYTPSAGDIESAAPGSSRATEKETVEGSKKESLLETKVGSVDAAVVLGVCLGGAAFVALITVAAVMIRNKVSSRPLKAEDIDLTYR